MENMDSNLIIQIFADDISVALAHQDRERLIQIAWKLREVIHILLKGMGLNESLPKCNNFLVAIIREVEMQAIRNTN